MHIVSKSLADTEQAAKQFIESLEMLPQKDHAIICCLYGDLGSGKTTFTQALARQLGIEETITSPTFVIQKRYRLPKPFGKIKTLIHIDAYRLENSRELAVLGWQKDLADPSHLIMLEWPERVADILPEDALKLSFEFVDEQTRIIEF